MKPLVDDSGAVIRIELNKTERRRLAEGISILEQAGYHMRGSATGEKLSAAGETGSALLASTQPKRETEKGV